MFKFADDVDLVTTTDNYDLILDELKKIAEWAERNNLKLNKSKTKEIIFHNARNRLMMPPPLEEINRVSSIKLLGITFQSNLLMNNHVEEVLTSCSNMLYALKILRSQGMDNQGLQDVFRSKVVSRITYASSSWWGMASEAVIGRINAFLRRSIKFGYYPADGLMFEELCELAEDKLFSKIQKNKNHVLYNNLPDKKNNKLQSKEEKAFLSLTG